MKILLVGNYRHDGQESMLRFAEMMLRELVARGVDAELICPEPFFGNLRKSGTGLGKWLGYLDKFLLFPRVLRRRMRGLRARGVAFAVHICDHSNAFYTSLLNGVPHVVTCHDLLAIRSARGEIPDNLTRGSGRVLQRYILRGLNQAQLVACVSMMTRSDVLRLTTVSPERVFVVPNALNYPYAPMATEEARARLRALAGGAAWEVTGFLLHVGGNQWYKNRMGVLRIFAALTSRLERVPQLVMAGKLPSEELVAWARKEGIAERVTYFESCGNEDLRALYTLAEALLFPSLAEGFGWPVIEAQACGCPVITSDVDPLREVAGESALLLATHEEYRFVEAILQARQPAERERLRERGFENVCRFSHEAMIEAYRKIYHQLEGDLGAARRSPSWALAALVPASLLQWFSS